MDRFDDVVFHIVEEPEPPRPRRPRRVRRWLLGAAVGVVLAGGLAAGASALTGGGAKPPSAASERAVKPPLDSSRLPKGHLCHHGHFHDGAAYYSPSTSSQ